MLRNVVQLLQERPERYKAFGVFWWPVKAILKHQGYGPDQLYFLGDYVDPSTVDRVAEANLADTLHAAILEYNQNLTFPHPGGVVEDPDGELIIIYDADAGL